MIKLPRRRFLHLAAGAAALPNACRTAMAESPPTPPMSVPPERPLAQRLAAYAHALRYDDLDAATLERVKVHVIDTIGCGIGAFDERAVRICREVALAVPGNATVIGTRRRTTPAPMVQRSAISISTTLMSGDLPFIQAIRSPRALPSPRPSRPTSRI
jgi:2-methylcitrate dehydratase